MDYFSGAMPTHTGKTPVSGYGKIKKRIDDWISEKREEKKLPEMSPWVLHDLRRTFVTHANDRLEIPPHVIEACVNHVSSGAKMGVAGVYNKALYLKERRVAFNGWEKLLRDLIHVPK